MTTPDICPMTAQVFEELEAMLRRAEAMDAPWQALLRQKLDAAQVVASAQLPADVVRPGCRVTYRVGDSPAITRTLVCSAEHNAPDWAVSLHNRHGLALLGLAAGRAIDIALPDGGVQTVQVDAVTAGDESERVVPLRRFEPRLVSSNKVVTLPFPRRPAPSRQPEGPDDDDPGPHAA